MDAQKGVSVKISFKAGVSDPIISKSKRGRGLWGYPEVYVVIVVEVDGARMKEGGLARSKWMAS